MEHDKKLQEIGRRIVALDLWKAVARYTWAVKPRGVAFPYFVAMLTGEDEAIAGHMMLLDGWQTFHDYIATRHDNSFGFYSSPSEMPHFAMLADKNGRFGFFRHDTGYVPREELTSAESGLLSRILWEVYGVMMRMESDPELAMRYSADGAVFARVEDGDGNWSDQPLQIPQPRAHIEKISVLKSEVEAAKELPFAAGEKLAVDFRLLPGLRTLEPRPRSAYVFCGIDADTGETAFRRMLSTTPEGGLRELWESLTPRLLKEIAKRGRIPGEVQVVSQRVFRMLRPLCSAMPLKLSLHDSIPALIAAIKG